jgi:bifunctional DNase/RNase
MLEARVEHVEIHSLVEGTFYGRLVLAYEGETLKVDSRASDAVALALRCHVPILVATAVMDEAGVTSVAATAEAHRENPATEDDEDTLPSDPVARLEALLQRAVEAEEYEEAARIRDEIKNQRSHN